MTTWTGGNVPLADVVPQAVAAPAPRLLTDNATDTLRGIALVVLANLIWTLGDATAKWVLPTVGVAGAMMWRGIFGMVTVAAVTTMGRPVRDRLAAVEAAAVGVGAGAQRVIVVRVGDLVHLLAVDEPSGHLRGRVHRTADHDLARDTDAGRADSLAPGVVHAGGVRRRTDHAATRRRSVDAGRAAAAGRDRGDGLDPHHDKATDRHGDAGMPGVLAADRPHPDRFPAAAGVSRLRGGRDERLACAGLPWVVERSGALRVHARLCAGTGIGAGTLRIHDHALGRPGRLPYLR